MVLLGIGDGEQADGASVSLVHPQQRCAGNSVNMLCVAQVCTEQVC